jgi:type VI secretion system protein ImpI
MRLELRQISGGEPAGKWFFERGKRTLGRSSDCDWQLADPRRLISKSHCTIERDRDGFLLRDQSANGTRVDGVTVFEGETARLSDKSRVAFGDIVFSVAISGEAERDMGDPDAGLRLSDEPLTISSILADIAPGGHAARGILGEHDPDNWSSGSPPERPAKGAPSSRNVEIGWDGPPAISTMNSMLPDDWNADFDLGSQLEHGSATRVSVPVMRNAGTAENDSGARTIVAANDTDHDPGRTVAPAGDLLPRLEILVSALELAFAEAASVFDADGGGERDGDFAGQDQGERLVARLEALVSRQTAFNAGLENLVREASQIMEPRMVEASVDAAGRKLPWRGRADYWRAYRARFEKDGRSLSVRELFAEAIRASMTRRKEQDDAAWERG